MPENVKEKKSSLLAIIASIIVVILIGVGVFMITKKKPSAKKTAEIGTIKTEPIFVKSELLQFTISEVGLSTVEFKEAREKIQKMVSKNEKEFKDSIKGLDPRKKEDAKKINKLGMKYHGNLKKEARKIMYLLKKKTETAIATVAVEKNMNTVIDKGIVVCGAEDITEDVVKKIKELKGLKESQLKAKMPEEAKLKELVKNSKVAYFNKNVVLSLPDFQRASRQLEQYKIEMLKKYNEKAKKLNDQQKMQLLVAMDNQLIRARNDLLAPLNRDVNRAVKSVAEGNGLILVINGRNIMYGGKNITDDVATHLSGVAPSKGKP